MATDKPVDALCARAIAQQLITADAAGPMTEAAILAEAGCKIVPRLAVARNTVNGQWWSES